MKVKVGAFLTNLMCKNLKFKVGNHEYMLLKPQVVKNTSGPVGSGSQKFIGFVSFNKGFIEDFIGELDKIHDLNLQMDRSVPMIYPPAPWKNFFFGTKCTNVRLRLPWLMPMYCRRKLRLSLELALAFIRATALSQVATMSSPTRPTQ